MEPTIVSFAITRHLTPEESNLVHLKLTREILPKILEAARNGTLDWAWDSQSHWAIGTWKGYKCRIGATIFNGDDKASKDRVTAYFLDLGPLTTWTEPHEFGASLGGGLMVNSKYVPQHLYAQLQELYRFGRGGGGGIVNTAKMSLDWENQWFDHPILPAIALQA